MDDCTPILGNHHINIPFGNTTWLAGDLRINMEEYSWENHLSIVGFSIAMFDYRMDIMGHKGGEYGH